MPSLSFQKRFAERVERGEKTHSIRPRRKRPEQWHPGRKVHLFTAMRTAHCRRLGTGVITESADLTIVADGVYINEQLVRDRSWLSAFAVQDGFEDWNDFIQFFSSHYPLPWAGTMIKWRLLPSEVAA